MELIHFSSISFPKGVIFFSMNKIKRELLSVSRALSPNRPYGPQPASIVPRTLFLPCQGLSATHLEVEAAPWWLTLFMAGTWEGLWMPGPGQPSIQPSGHLDIEGFGVLCVDMKSDSS